MEAIGYLLIAGVVGVLGYVIYRRQKRVRDVVDSAVDRVNDDS